MPPNNTMKLSVCIPSHRPLISAAGTILKMVDGLPPDIQIVVSDNSVLADKREFLQKLADKHENLTLLLHDTEIPAHDNFQAALNAATGDVISFCGDDDIMFPEALLYARQHLQDNPSYACSSGAICDYRPALGPRMIGPADYTGKWSDRILDYLFRAPLGGNFLFYAAYRRAILHKYFDYVAAHPLVYTFFDFHLPILALSIGEGHVGKIGMAVYDNRNWETEAACISSWAAHCKTLGLPTWFMHLQNLYRAVEYLLFIGGEFFDNPKEERLSLGLDISERYFRAWRNRIPQFFDALPDPVKLIVVKTLRPYGADPVPHSEIVNLFMAILDTINPAIGLKYRDFFGRNMGL